MEKTYKAISQTELDVGRRMEEFGLTKDGLLRVADKAKNARWSATTKFYPATAPSTLAYMEGISALRDEFRGKEWETYYYDGIEGIVNHKKEIVVSFTNVHLACKDEILPQPISPKGLASERACSGNIDPSGQNECGQRSLFHSPRLTDYRFYYLMLDKHGNVELSSPVIRNERFRNGRLRNGRFRNGRFSTFNERIYLRKGMESKGEAKPSIPEEPVSGDLGGKIIDK